MMRNSGGNWGYVAKTLHWSAAALIITMLGLGLAMVHSGLGSGAKFETYQLHKEIGFFVMAVRCAAYGAWQIPRPPSRLVCGPGNGSSPALFTLGFMSSSQR